MTTPRYTPLTQSLPATVPFVGPETQERERGAPFVARLGANENIFGPSPKAIAAMQAEAGEIWKYGDAQSYDLRMELARFHGVAPENILVGEGIDGLLGYLVRMLVTSGDHVVTSLGAYPTFNYHVAGFGGTLHTVPYRDDHEDPEALFAKAAEVDAKLVYLANPDNPMGSWHSGADIVAALDHLPDGCLLLLDEAYVECAPEGTAAPVDINDTRVIRMRTFSKAYGMAGARVGYAMAQADLISAFNKVRNHFGMNRMAQAGALAALRDQDWLAHVTNEIAVARTRIGEIASENGLTALPSATNFVAIDCGQDGAFAKAVLDGLVDQGVFVRMPFAAPQNRCIRVSCGRPQELDAFAKALPIALERARQA
ncbi:pyridoxal phosphate-dependent aminotransferase [Phaeobacter gallaeciensis]|uniref:pyridoxal phosphate-dependent aminotransferase n=1 Tax=Phaeobacter gallaeciensis TaxID=60890 RepID=UPI00237FC71A|nr:pyridoxal phosphate-dependent aminotransferase [Phaeobacter gallaeciensis]MDE4191024.1 pyridoxal phosphate-dependent aminotransferase [Phaeobacter gallaeciensis]MDE4199490.1 pyridoxal phosphate-dependent aminotransferase [Phaeobacter gallaeciensis]MDE4203638.1 pyridoxal phosphate-dependent aminotransferase [Phaeobacter gallaeciensis]MDE4207780.1 pyridoxal phosphate-dependent aminotransferase [Phaeobacter gallaeciensis]MDE4216147.1 pyridoxal phosphate-dependent aminotransferase [Phaeobacter 